jgi:hypothetical protein
MKLNDKEKNILKLAYMKNKRGIPLTKRDCFKFYSAPHYIDAKLDRLVVLGLLKTLEDGGLIITAEGKEQIGIESDKKITEFVEVKNGI